MKRLEIRQQHWIDELIVRYPTLECIREKIIDGYLLLRECYCNNGKILVTGNGGSAADAEHIVGELMKEFRIKRSISSDEVKALMEADKEKGEFLSKKLVKSLPAISLNSHFALNSAVINDVDGSIYNAQQVFGYGNSGDVFVGISTSGNSENIKLAAITSKAKKMKVIVLTGNTGGELAKIADVSVIVPEKETYKIQEMHLPIYHCWCLMLEEYFFGKEED